MMEHLLKRRSCLLGKHAESRILLLLVPTLAMVEPGKPPISVCPVMALLQNTSDEKGLKKRGQSCVLRRKERELQYSSIKAYQKKHLF